MSVLLQRRAERFADLLEHDLQSDDPALSPHLSLARSLRAVPAPAGPAPEFRSALRQRLVAVATVQATAPAAQPSAGQRLREAGTTWRFQRRMAVLAGGAAAATAIAGVGLGASRSLPGDAFYGVKRATEDVQLAATLGQEAKGKRHLEFARTRLAEVTALAGHVESLAPTAPGAAVAAASVPAADRTDIIVATLHEMDEQTRAGALDLLAVYTRSGDREPLQTLDAFARQQYGDLQAVLPTLPSAARPHGTSSLALLHQVAAETVQLAVRPPRSAPAPQPTETSPSQPARHHRHHSERPGSTSTSTTPAAPSGDGESGAGTPDPATRPSTPTVIPSLPTIVPTIPPLVDLGTVTPDQLPSELPTLPDVSDLPLLGN